MIILYLIYLIENFYCNLTYIQVINRIAKDIFYFKIKDNWIILTVKENFKSNARRNLFD